MIIRLLRLLKDLDYYTYDGSDFKIPNFPKTQAEFNINQHRT